MSIEHIHSIDDLVTTREKTKEGFIKLALEKSRRASGYIEEGRALKAAVLSVAEPSNLYNVEGIMKSLLTASGLSDKAMKHLDEPAQLHLVQQLIEKHLEPSRDFVNELVYRFLLVRGDSFGGSMRNIAGFLAEDIFKRSVFAALKTYNIRFHWRSKKFKEWTNEPVPLSDTDDIDGVHWIFRSNVRTLLFNKSVPLIQKNVDVIVLNSPFSQSYADINDPQKYVVLGELKGGIDPAGADEHWKTARTAIDRINRGFKSTGNSVQTVFIGAAIEQSMAMEILEMVKMGTLSMVGNLTNPDHLAAVCNWLIQ